VITAVFGAGKRLWTRCKKACQGGKSDQSDASDCEDGKYKV